ncbi:MAG: metal-sulfur cluster assembly factor [Rhodocyclaceae bacterium]|nr:metal-sulfur cluster assembly factor [Rhodocyclaceae bacterium]
MTETLAPTDAVRAALRHVIDPEVGMNVVDLGLVYRIETEPAVVVEMTMTSPTCPMGDLILEEARHELAEAFPDAPPADIRLVWEPPWHPSMMSDRAKQSFGWQADGAD